MSLSSFILNNLSVHFLSLLTKYKLQKLTTKFFMQGNFSSLESSATVNSAYAGEVPTSGSSQIIREVTTRRREDALLF